MAQHLCVKLAFCVIIVVTAEAGVLKSRQISLPPGAVEMDVAIRQKINNTESKTIATMKIEIDGDNRKVTLFDAAAEMPPDSVVEIKNGTDFVPDLEDRSLFPKTSCPQGYVKRGSVCFPDYDE